MKQENGLDIVGRPFKRGQLIANAKITDNYNSSRIDWTYHQVLDLEYKTRGGCGEMLYLEYLHTRNLETNEIGYVYPHNTVITAEGVITGPDTYAWCEGL